MRTETTFPHREHSIDHLHEREKVSVFHANALFDNGPHCLAVHLKPVQGSSAASRFAARTSSRASDAREDSAERAEAAGKADKNRKTDVGVLLAIGRTYVRCIRGRLLVLLRRHELDRAAILASIRDYVEHLLLLCLRNTQ